MNTPKIAVLIGTRPGIIKMSPIIHELRKKGIPKIVIHTGQHYSANMDRDIMNDVGLAEPDYHIKRPKGAVSHAQQTAYMLIGTEEVLLKEKPNILLVCGDANTNLAGALAARKIHITVGHVEAGLRSFDWRMPEEHNRIIIDHISEYLFAPTHQAKSFLMEDGVRGKIYVVGNTIVDATLEYAAIAKRRNLELLQEVTRDSEFILLTLHREENVDNEAVLTDLLAAIQQISELSNLQIVFPVHPRTRKRFHEMNLNSRIKNIRRLRMIQPLGYFEFLAFLDQAKFSMTDSGGVQEESCILKIPCITLRKTTERQETVKVGANSLAGTKKDDIIKTFENVLAGLSSKNDWKNPYGDGKASRRIVEVCTNGYPKDEVPPDAS